jgi:hypothetical protein
LPRKFLSEQLTNAEVQEHCVKMYAFEKATSNVGREFPSVIILANGALMGICNYLDASFSE